EGVCSFGNRGMVEREIERKQNELAVGKPGFRECREPLQHGGHAALPGRSGRGAPWPARRIETVRLQFTDRQVTGLVRLLKPFLSRERLASSFPALSAFVGQTSDVRAANAD